jgi:hypothetical protein
MTESDDVNGVASLIGVISSSSDSESVSEDQYDGIEAAEAIAALRLVQEIQVQDSEAATA